MGRYLYAVFAVSLFLHLLVFWPSAFRPASPAVAPLLVRFVGMPPPISPSSGSAPSPAGEEVPQRGEVLSDGRRIVRRSDPIGGAAGRNQATIVKERHGAERSAQRPSPGVEGVLVERARSDSEDDVAHEARVGRYRLALAVAAVRLQHASGMGAAAGQQGRAVVVVHVMAGGSLPDVRLAESSGASAMDDSALALVRRAVLHVPPPESGQPFSVTLPLLFEAM